MALLFYAFVGPIFFQPIEAMMSGNTVMFPGAKSFFFVFSLFPGPQTLILFCQSRATTPTLSDL